MIAKLSGFLMLCWLAASLSGCVKSNPPAANSNELMEPAVSMITASDPRIAVMGRTEKMANGNLRFAYPGVTLTFNIKSHSAKLFAHSTSAQSYLEIIIDNGDSQIIKLSEHMEPIALFSGKETAVHHVEIIHRSETWHGTVTIGGIEINNGELLAPSLMPEKRLLILGDSVTCGEAIERQADCKKTSGWWNPRLSYGMLAAKALNAQVHLVCYGGRGLVRSWNGKTDEQNLPDFFELTLADPQAPVTWDHSRYTPDVILSAIGTNDFSQGIPEQNAYITTYVSLVQRLRHLYPNAHIALTEGAILNGDKKSVLQKYLMETAQRLNDPYVRVVPSNHYSGDDCDAHPTKEQHAKMANDLIPLLRNLLESR
jgi:lysophospholipase L1-like esterase